MTQIFFYHGASDKIAAAGALIAGAYAKGKKLLVYAPEEQIADLVDRHLWTASQLSFVPHCRDDSPLAEETPIIITRQLAQPSQLERLMNLGQDIPPGFDRFDNVVEVVGQSDDDRTAARQRVGHYKANGHEVRYFDLSQH